jgi:O-antigen ligase
VDALGADSTCQTKAAQKKVLKKKLTQLQPIPEFKETSAPDMKTNFGSTGREAGRREQAELEAVDGRLKWFAGLTGVWLGLALLKFGNPIILDRMVHRPEDVLELVLQPWPVRWGYILFGLLVLSGIFMGVLPRRLKEVAGSGAASRWILILPLIWLGWQFVSALGTVDAELTRATLIQFSVNTACFFLGVLVLARLEFARSFWLPLLIGFVLVMWAGFGQHYGGLQMMRELVYAQPGWEQLPDEYLRRLASQRIFGTLLYPNALAGVILLLLPALLVASWRMAGMIPKLTRMVVAGFVFYAGVACLVWSGSKAGWLIALGMAVLVFLHQELPRKIKVGLVILLVAGGGIGFAVQFASWFERGAPSAVARMDYWRAGIQTWKDNPILGTGPGTFSVAYGRIKPPEAEMARLAHNDYLQQASDSGVIGFLSYLLWVGGALAVMYGKVLRRGSAIGFAVWLGLFGWGAQGLVEFGLYIPAISWPAFILLGWGVGVKDARERKE